MTRLPFGLLILLGFGGVSTAASVNLFAVDPTSDPPLPFTILTIQLLLFESVVVLYAMDGRR